MPTENGRVTVRELYELILKQNEERYAMERRLTDRIEILTKCLPMIEVHGQEINHLRVKSDRNDILTAAFAVIGSAIAGWLGVRN